MRKIKNELDELVYEQYGDELNAKDKEIENKNKQIKTKDKQIKNLQNQLKKLNELDDLNTPEARKILNSLIAL